MPGMKKLMALANGTAVSRKIEKVDEKVITKMLDTEGDIILEIGPKKKRVQVNSKELSKSTVFKKIIEAHDKENSKGAGPAWSTVEAVLEKGSEKLLKVIQLQHDDYTALHFVLCILHSEFAILPDYRSVSFNDALNLAVICNKYNLSSRVTPFLKDYVLTWWNYKDVRMNSVAWLFIAYTFGFERYFDMVFDGAVREVALDRKFEASGHEDTMKTVHWRPPETGKAVKTKALLDEKANGPNGPYSSSKLQLALNPPQLIIDTAASSSSTPTSPLTPITPVTPITPRTSTAPNSPTTTDTTATSTYTPTSKQPLSCELFRDCIMPRGARGKSLKADGSQFELTKSCQN
jgi:hypothetical protein